MSGEIIDLMVNGLSLCRFKHLHKILQKCDSGVYQHVILHVNSKRILLLSGDLSSFLLYKSMGIQ